MEEKTPNTKVELIHVIVIIIMTIIATLTTYYFMLGDRFHKEDVDLSKYEQQIKQLEQDNTILRSSIDALENRVIDYNKYIDSLKTAKNKIKLVYDSKYKEIDNASADRIVFQLDSIFTAHNIK
jgi:cell division protein FtsB